MKYKFGLRGHDAGNTFEEMCKNAKKSGIKNLQFALAKTVSEINFDEVGYDAALSKKIKDSLDEYNLHISVLGCYISPVAADKNVLETQLTRFKNFLYYAKDFGADVIGTETPGKKTREESHSEETYTEFIRNMYPIVKEAEKLGVTIGIEPVYADCIFSPERARRMLDDFNSDNVAIILDVSNMIYPETRHMQKEIINASFDLFGDKIKAVHIKDFTFDENKKSFAITGTGELMIELIFDSISKLKNPPEIILDETPISRYEESLASLSKKLG